VNIGMNGVIIGLDWTRDDVNYTLILTLHGLSEILIRQHDPQFLSTLLSLRVIRPALRAIIVILAIALGRGMLNVTPDTLQLLEVFLIVHLRHNYRNWSIAWFEIILCPIKSYRLHPESTSLISARTAN
jgi:hypothetical protein